MINIILSKERKNKKAQDNKNIIKFWEEFNKLSIEDKKEILEIMVPIKWIVLLNNEQADKREKKLIKFNQILPEWLWPNILYNKSKAIIKQEKIKIWNQENLISTLSSDKK